MQTKSAKEGFTMPMTRVKGPLRIIMGQALIDWLNRSRLYLTVGLVSVVGSCGTNQSSGQEFLIEEVTVRSAGPLITFVEAHDPRDGLGAGGFGDIVIFDPETGKKSYVTRDGYLDENPCLSPNGQYLAFGSTRGGKPALIKIAGLAARQNLYVADLSRGTAKRIGTNFMRDNPTDTHSFGGLSWSKSSSSLYYLSPDSAIFILPSLGESLFVFAECPFAKSIEGLSVSNDDSLFACDYSSVPLDSIWIVRKGISIYHAFEKRWQVVVKDVEGYVGVGGWSNDSRFLLLIRPDLPGTRLWRYHCETNRMEPIIMPKTNFGLLDIQKPYFLGQDTLVFLASYRRTDESGRKQRTATDLFRYDMRSQLLDQLSTDGSEKKMLRVTTR